ncbi:MAG TPA: hypothetical protein VHX64_11675 [Caulobacteraceae bacterium]|nr:hypothetical protein [Caulobacteraceae bacterium]
MKLRLIPMAAGLVLLAGPVLAQNAPAPSADSAPVSTAQSTDQKISEWLDDKSSSDAPKTTKSKPEDFVRDPGDGKGDRKIHGEFGAGVGSDGYRSAYGVATIPIGKDSSVTVAASTSHGPIPWVAGGPWSYGPAGYGAAADCVCREAPDGSQVCRVARAASYYDAQLAEASCDSAPP